MRKKEYSLYVVDEGEKKEDEDFESKKAVEKNIGRKRRWEKYEGW